MADLFEYLDYRKFLKDTFEEKKSAGHGFSHRVFQRIAEFKSTNYLMLVMQGKRNLSSNGIHKVAKALKLKKTETEFFENLVRFNQAASDQEKNFYYSKVSENRRYLAARPLEKGQFDYYSKWYVPVIRELTLVKNFKEDPAWIASMLRPSITPKQAAGALKLLMEMGLIVRDAKGKFVQKDPHVASGDEIKSLALTNFQREMIELAARSIDKTRPAMREVGSLTFAVSKCKLAEAKKMIREFRSRLAGFLAEEKSADAVYQFNFQLFNLSEHDDEEAR